MNNSWEGQKQRVAMERLHDEAEAALKKARDERDRARGYIERVEELRRRGVAKASFHPEGYLASVEFFEREQQPDRVVVGVDPQIPHGAFVPALPTPIPKVNEEGVRIGERGFFKGIDPADPLLDTAKTK